PPASPSQPPMPCQSLPRATAPKHPIAPNHSDPITNCHPATLPAAALPAGWRDPGVRRSSPPPLHPRRNPPDRPETVGTRSAGRPHDPPTHPSAGTPLKSPLANWHPRSRRLLNHKRPIQLTTPPAIHTPTRSHTLQPARDTAPSTKTPAQSPPPSRSAID